MVVKEQLTYGKLQLGFSFLLTPSSGSNPKVSFLLCSRTYPWITLLRLKRRLVTS